MRECPTQTGNSSAVCRVDTPGTDPVAPGQGIGGTAATINATAKVSRIIQDKIVLTGVTGELLHIAECASEASDRAGIIGTGDRPGIGPVASAQLISRTTIAID